MSFKTGLKLLASSGGTAQGLPGIEKNPITSFISGTSSGNLASATTNMAKVDSLMQQKENQKSKALQLANAARSEQTALARSALFRSQRQQRALRFGLNL